MPPYNPWEQRLCLVPDGDLFEAVKSGQGFARHRPDRAFRCNRGPARIGHSTSTPTSSSPPPGSTLTMGGKIALTLDGRKLDFAEHWFYRGCMFSNVPNFAVVFGYLNASWTLRADNTANYICEVLNRMEALGADMRGAGACPRITGWPKTTSTPSPAATSNARGI